MTDRAYRVEVVRNGKATTYTYSTMPLEMVREFMKGIFSNRETINVYTLTGNDLVLSFDAE